MTEAAQVADARIVVVPATPDRWADVVTILGGNGDRGCWCQAPRGRTVGYGKTPIGERREALRSQIENEPPPGMLAYVDGAVGYVGLTPMFEKVGFRRLLETAAHSDRRPRWLYRLDFEAAGSPGA